MIKLLIIVAAVAALFIMPYDDQLPEPQATPYERCIFVYNNAKQCEGYRPKEGEEQWKRTKKSSQ